MSKLAKCFAVLLLVLLASTILASLNLSASAQDDGEVIISPVPTLPDPSEGQAEVVLVASEGGTTNPAPGSHFYWNNSIIKLEAIPDNGYDFLQWVITGGYTPSHNEPPLLIPGPIEVDGQPALPPPRLPTASTYDSLIATQNPLYVVCGYGYTFSYEAVFVTTTPTGTERSDAIVVVADAVGGSTNPGPGTYTFAEGESFALTATPDEGQEFQYWIASGTGVAGHESTLLVDNPLNILCGIGYTYEYQPVFTATGTAAQGVPVEYLYAIIIVLAIIAVIGIGAALMYRGRSK